MDEASGGCHASAFPNSNPALSLRASPLPSAGLRPTAGSVVDNSSLGAVFSQHTPLTMSLLRTAMRARVSARAFSTTPARLDVTVPGGVNPTSVGPKFDAESELDSFVPPARWSTKHVQPTDVVAGREPGPPTEHEDAKEITFDVVSEAPKELRHRQVSRTIVSAQRTCVERTRMEGKADMGRGNVRLQSLEGGAAHHVDGHGKSFS